MTTSQLNLSERQKMVLECVIEANKEGKRPYTRGVVKRMCAKGHDISERQCAYDLGVIIHTQGTGVYSAKFDNNPKLWIYEEAMAEDKL